MKYVGSKARLAKDIVPIIQKYIDDNGITKYLEPFVGGANVIDKIRCEQRVGCDKNKYLIDLLNYLSSGGELPDEISEEEYISVKNNMGCHPDWYVGLVGLCTFGAKWFGGYPRGYKADGVTPRNITNEAIRNMRKQQKNLANIKFFCREFQTLHDLHDCVIYCDPPYKDTTKYATGNFDYELFYQWCKKMSKNNIVLVSEYDMSDGFDCVWQKELRCTLDKSSRTNRIEKLFICR